MAGDGRWIAGLAAAPALLWSAAGADAWAQANGEQHVVRDLIGKPGDADTFRLQTDFPVSPAYAVLGEDPAALQNVRNFEELGVQLLNGFDENFGLTGNGLSIGGRPYWWGDRSDLTLCGYSGGARAEDASCQPRTEGGDGRLGRIYQRSYFSLATVREEAEAGEDVWRAGLALTTELLDLQDIRYMSPGGPKSRLSSLGECLGANAASADAEAYRVAGQEALSQVTAAYPALGREAIEERAELLLAEQMRRRIEAGEQAREPTAFDRFSALANAVTEVAIDRGLRDAALRAPGQLFSSVFYAELPRPAEDLKDDVYDACLKARSDELERRPSLRVGVAHALTSETGKLDDFEGEAVSLWVSGRLPTPEFISNSSVNAFVQYDADRLLELAPMEEGGAPMEPPAEDAAEPALAEADRLQGALGFAVTTDTLTLSASVSYVDVDFASDAVPDDSYTLVSIAASRRLRDGVWLELGVGKSDSDRLADEEFVNLRLKVDWNRLGG